jgi:hypothetical protein
MAWNCQQDEVDCCTINSTVDTENPFRGCCLTNPVHSQSLCFTKLLLDLTTNYREQCFLLEEVPIQT